MTLPLRLLPLLIGFFWLGLALPATAQEPGEVRRAAIQQALFEATRTGDKDLAEQALLNGAEVNAVLDDGWTPLMQAAYGGLGELVVLLIEAGADVGPRENRFGNTALIWAARAADPVSIRAILSAGADPDEADTKDGLTPLIHAAGNSRPTRLFAVEALIEAGAQVNKSADDGFTPLMSAARIGDGSVVSALLGAGADADARSEDGRSALTLATSTGNASLVRLLLDREVTVLGSDVLAAVDSGEREALARLLEAGGPVDARDGSGQTALMRAAKIGHTDIIALLLLHGAEINAGDERTGATALMFAANRGLADVVDVLLRAGADPGLADRDGWTAAEAARMVSADDVLRLLESAR
ncbi:MAG: ankyrin repeat domain-containing protein [Magnetovibrionaceae bacterium]